MRRLKRREHHLHNEKLIAALAANKSEDFWKDIKRIHSVHQKPTTPHINGLSNDNDIANLFADQFAKTLNICTDAGHVSSTPPDCSSADLLQHYISPECVSEAIKHLKHKKSDSSELDSDHLILASEAISESLSCLFTAMLRHGHFPASIRDCMLIPIPKRGKDIAQSESYRAIALASNFSKLFEWCLLLQFPHYFCTSDLQFGFKNSMSTSLCTGTIKNVVARYIHRKTPVFACF